MSDDRANVIVDLRDVEHVRQREGMDWLPVRRTLGIASFGISAYVAPDAGELVPEHAVLGGGAGRHEEL